MSHIVSRYASIRVCAACVVIAVLFGGAVSAASAAITIDTVPIGNPGNQADTRYDPNGVGSVGYNFRIGKYEVTNALYVEFLNGVDPTGANSLALYSPVLASDTRVSILQDLGAANGSKYSVKPGRDNNPVVWVSLYDTFRFANWLHNGQGSGNTENGAYTLLGGTPTPSNGNSVTRNAGAKWWLPSEDEWYKAAYHKNDGVTGNYWDYPTSTDAFPYSDQPPGSDAPDPSNTANFYKDDGVANGYDDGFAVTGSTSFNNAQNIFTDVGAYTLSTSPYGTFDQGGNVWELNDALVLRGGSWGDFDPHAPPPGAYDSIHASFRIGAFPFSENAVFGFRIATSVPEPSALNLGTMAMIGIVWRRRRRGNALLPTPRPFEAAHF